MAVRFACPSCQQPIEIDDQWAGQSVACPYCRRVVSAPRETNWPAAEIPMATPAAGGLGAPPPPLPPMGYSPSQSLTPAAHDLSVSRAQGGSANQALALAIAAAVLSVIGVMIWFMLVVQTAVDRLGANATPQQIQQTYEQMLLKRTAPASPAATTVLLVGAVCGIGAVGLGVRAIVRGEAHKGRAIAACIIAAMFGFCQILMITAMLQLESAVASASRMGG